MLPLCRTCHDEVTTSGYIAINDNNVNSARVKSQLLLCVPELRQDLVKDPVLCSTCVGALSLVCSFKTQCLQTEERIRNYFQNTKLIEKSVTFVELYRQDTKFKSDAPCSSLDVEGLVLKTSNIAADSDSDEDAGTESVIGLVADRGNINSEDVENGGIVKEEFTITQFNIEDNFKEDYFTSNVELEKLSLLQLLDESLQQMPQNHLKNSENEDLPRSQHEKVLKATLSSARSENQCVTIEVAESANSQKEKEYLKKKSLVSNVITDTHSNSKGGLREMQASNIRSKELFTKECFVKLVRIDDMLQLQSENALKTIVLRNKPEKHSKSTDNGKGQDGLLTEIAASTLVIDTGDTPYGCTVCEFRTSLRKSLIQHMRTCEFRSARQDYLKPHMRTDTGKTAFQCNTCGFRTSRKYNLKLHIKSHKDKKPFSCRICDYASGQPSKLKIHMRTHTGEKPFQCNICDFRTAQRHHLKRHIRTHTMEKPFLCTICEFRTARQDHLKRHMRSHTGEKPFQCNICEFRTARRSTLKIHTRSHTGEKLFQCSICDFVTTQGYPLKRHMSTHTGVKPFQCSICDFATAQGYPLKRHMRTHTGKT